MDELKLIELLEKLKKTEGDKARCSIYVSLAIWKDFGKAYGRNRSTVLEHLMKLAIKEAKARGY